MHVKTIKLLSKLVPQMGFASFQTLQPVELGRLYGIPLKSLIGPQISTFIHYSVCVKSVAKNDIN